MPIFKTKNENFFKKWSPEMAYILGFFAADGSMYKTKRGTHFIEFQITDKELLKQIRKLFDSNHKIAMRNRNKKWKLLYRLQIGSKAMFGDLIKLGMTPRKSKTIKFPDIPVHYLIHFVRGYFDGDGNVWSGLMHKTDRKKPSRTLIAGFTCGSKKFLISLMKFFFGLFRKFFLTILCVSHILIREKVNFMKFIKQFAFRSKCLRYNP